MAWCSVNHRDVNAKAVREEIFKPTIGTEKLHDILKSTLFPHRNIHKYTWTITDENTHNRLILS